MESRVHFRLYLITDRKLAERYGGLPATVAAALSAAATVAPAGAVAIQLREKDLSARALFELGDAIRPQCRRYGALLLVNDRLDVALALEADGVQLPSGGVAVGDARRLLGRERLIGVSTHQSMEVAAAHRVGADFVVFGPVYTPLSKVAAGPGCGPEGLAAAVRAADGMPVYALGGLTAARVRELGGAAAFGQGGRPSGVSAIGAVLGAKDPAEATRELLRALAMWEVSAAR